MHSVSRSVPDASAVAHRVWFGDGTLPRLARLTLAPVEAAFRGGVAVRGAMYDRGLLRARQPAVPALSVGNLSVGGTGKTPVAAWLAARLLASGARPAIVMRGYGGDEALVHAMLNPEIPVVTAPDRLEGALRAARQSADCVVLDDAFQHRRVARVVDAVLVSADSWNGRVRLLPAGPWREPLRALSRATLLIVTRKRADLASARALAEGLSARCSVPSAVVALRLGPLRSNGRTASLEALDGRSVRAVAAIGDPRSFQRQLERAGAVVRPAFFADHHRFSPKDVRRLATELRPDEWPVCTLKDYVKLAPLWPRQATSLWYVSQRVAPEAGEVDITAALDSVLRARTL